MNEGVDNDKGRGKKRKNVKGRINIRGRGIKGRVNKRA